MLGRRDLRCRPRDTGPSRTAEEISPRHLPVALPVQLLERVWEKAQNIAGLSCRRIPQIPKLGKVSPSGGESIRTRTQPPAPMGSLLQSRSVLPDVGQKTEESEANRKTHVWEDALK
jgi:hypothetical protein